MAKMGHTVSIQDHIKRKLENEVVRRLQDIECVALIGVRQTGKTTLAKAVMKSFPKSVYLDLGSEEDLGQLNKAESFFRQHNDFLIVIDEIQTRPHLFPILRSQIDERRSSSPISEGRFLILGSANEELTRQAASLTGRLSMIDVVGFHLLELAEYASDQDAAASTTTTAALGSGDVASVENNIAGKEHVERLWVRGGLPISYLSADTNFSFQWRRDFLEGYIHRDLKALGYEIDPIIFQNVWEILSKNQGNARAHSDYAGDLKVSKAVVDEAIGILLRLQLIRRLRPWFQNLNKQMKKQEKYFSTDSGLLHALLNLQTLDEIKSVGIDGPSWEGFIIHCLICSAPHAKDFYYYRDEKKNELDLVAELTADRRWAIEIKRNNNPSTNQSNINAALAVEAERRILVYPGDEVYELRGDFVAMPVFQACRELSTA